MSQTLYGKNALMELLRAGRRHVLEVLISSDPELMRLLESKKIRYKLAPRHQLDKLSQGANHHGVIAKVEDYPYQELEQFIASCPEEAIVVVCDSLNDPQNLGAICRSAHCFGAQAIIINKVRSVDVTPTVVSASAGAVEHLSVIRVTNLVRALEELKKNEFWCYAANPNAKDSLHTLKPSKRMAIVFGSEREGIRPLVLKTCDFHFSIPMKESFNSLNVAQSAAIVLYVLASKK